MTFHRLALLAGTIATLACATGPRASPPRPEDPAALAGPWDLAFVAVEGGRTHQTRVVLARQTAAESTAALRGRLCGSCWVGFVPASFLRTLPSGPSNSRVEVAWIGRDSLYLVLGPAGGGDDGSWGGAGEVTPTGAMGTCGIAGYVTMPCGQWRLQRPTDWRAPAGEISSLKRNN